MKKNPNGPKEIAIYGKGGIGKSTISANISASLSKLGVNVLQVGCDPKHDSTKLLMHGRKIKTILDYMREVKPIDYDITKVLFTGYNDIGCVEAGGPKPGVGCAGRGIISAFELLDQFQTKQQYDIVIYDVLGDVVCGGFAVPIRREYADIIFIVTSGEFMSLYAANNILKGIKNYDGNEHRVAGIIFNERGLNNESARVKLFAENVNLPIVAQVPRSQSFADAEEHNVTAVEYGDEDINQIFAELANTLIEGIRLHEAMPLDDENLENLFMPGCSTVETYSGMSSDSTSPSKAKSSDVTVKDFPSGNNKTGICPDNDSTPVLSKNLLYDEPLHGCAFNGSLFTGVHLMDIPVVAHSPKSCIHISNQTITSSGRRPLFERGSLLPAPIAPNLVSTMMDQSDMVFGGMDSLEATVKQLLLNEPPAILVVSSCPAGIIGDDIDRIKAMSTEKTKILTIKADGNLTGDYLQGMLTTYTELAKQVIDKEVTSEPHVVNIIFEKVIAKNTETNFQTMKGFFDKLGIKVNCRFLYNTSYESLKNFKKADLNILAYDDYTGKILRNFFEKNFNSCFSDLAFPVGYSQTTDWLKYMRDLVDKSDSDSNYMIAGNKHCQSIPDIESIIDASRHEYEVRIRRIKPILKGKKLMIITYNHNLDWILESCIDCGIEIVKIGILNFSQDDNFVSKISMDLPVEVDYNRDNRDEDLIRYRPDIYLTNYDSNLDFDCLTSTIPLCPDVGFFSGLKILENWAGLINMNLEGDWKKDESYYDKYYSR
ncbi:MAG: AAA family ATPase [Clostridiales bacterium]|nr:AAA family ATPase [Clostridiales bacterium]